MSRVRKITLFSSAQRDYREALEWYAEQSPRSADAFEAEVEAGLGRIHETPDAWPTCDDRHQFLMLRRFPFRIVYRYDAVEIFIVAIAHARRKPNYWRRSKRQ